MKVFYSKYLGLQIISEENGRHIFLRAGKSMLLIFNPNNTLTKGDTVFPLHGAISPPASVHFALEIEKEDYENSKNILVQNKTTNMLLDLFTLEIPLVILLLQKEIGLWKIDKVHLQGTNSNIGGWNTFDKHRYLNIK
jgi:hypothetical protein